MDLVVEAERDFGARTYSLFLPELRRELRAVAPHVFAIDADGGYLDRWRARIGLSAGVLVATRQDVDALAKHLRTIFIVQDETGQDFFFRYYDPRVLRSFLPTCTRDQLGEFFGPIDEFVAEAAEPGVVHCFGLERGSLRQRRFQLADGVVSVR